MITVTVIPLLLTLLPLAISHFTLDSPAARGFDEDKLPTFPCGGQDTPLPNRTLFPLTGGPVQLTMGHDEAAVQVLLGLGNDPGENFNITLLPTIQEEGLGHFCLGNISASMGMMGEVNITDGTNATIQVVTNGDSNGGLYNCADITFSSTAQPGSCANGTGVKAVPYTGKSTNANGTNSGTTSGDSSGTSSGTSAAPASTASTPSSGNRLNVNIGWGIFVGVVAVVGATIL